MTDSKITRTKGKLTVASFKKNATDNLVVSYTLTPGHSSAEDLEVHF